MTPGLVFYEKSHRYKLDGAWVPGVTTIINKGLPKPNLMYWSARTVAEFVADRPDEIETLWGMGRGPMVAALKEVPWQQRDTAAVKGTDVHNLAERVVRGEAVEVPELIAGYVDAAATFMDDWNIDPETTITEHPAASREHHYAGKFDLIADGAIWDYKTGSGVYGETALQLVAYANTEFYVDTEGQERPMADLGIDRAYAVHLRGDGGYDVIPLDFGPRMFADFLAVKAAAEVADRVKSYCGEPTQPRPFEVVA